MEEIRRISDKELDVNAGLKGNVIDMAVGVIIGGQYGVPFFCAAGTDRLAASTPGVTVTAPDGTPGGGAKIRVR